AGLERTEARRALAHLLRRLLGAHQQARVTRGGEATERLEQQRGLADAGLASEQRGGPEREPAAEHAVELADAGGPPRRLDRGDLGDRLRRALGKAGRRPGRRHHLGEAAPGVAVGAAAEPAWVLGAALGAAVDDAGLRAGL